MKLDAEGRLSLEFVRLDDMSAGRLHDVIPIGANCDRINFDSQRFGELCRLNRVQFAGVVFTIRKQDDHFAYRLTFIQSFSRSGDR